MCTCSNNIVDCRGKGLTAIPANLPESMAEMWAHYFFLYQTCDKKKLLQKKKKSSNKNHLCLKNNKCKIWYRLKTLEIYIFHDCCTAAITNVHNSLQSVFMDEWLTWKRFIINSSKILNILNLILFASVNVFFNCRGFTRPGEIWACLCYVRMLFWVSFFSMNHLAGHSSFCCALRTTHTVLRSTVDWNCMLLSAQMAVNHMRVLY